MTTDKPADKPKGPAPVDLTNAVRDTAYFLWEQDGRPAGREDYYWERALETHLRTRAFDIWLREGRPDGRAADHWIEASKAVLPKP